MRHSKGELGTFRRVWLMLFGLTLMGGFEHPLPVGWLIGMFGALVFLASSGLIELAMAIYYRLRRRAARHAH